MELGKCRECHKEVSTQAKTCPHCGVSRPAWDYSWVIVGWLLLGALVVAFVWSGGPTQQRTALRAAEPVEAAPPAPSPPAVDPADEIAKLIRFHKAIVQCNAKYDALMKKFAHLNTDRVTAYENYSNLKTEMLLILDIDANAPPGKWPRCSTAAATFASTEIGNLVVSIKDGFIEKANTQAAISDTIMRALDIGIYQFPPSIALQIKNERQNISAIEKEQRATFERAYKSLGVDDSQVDWKSGGLITTDSPD